MKISQEVFRKLDALVEKEKQDGVSEENRTHFKLDDAKTSRAVLMIHGLYNSPADLNDFYKVFSEKKFNIINMRLSGHYEKDRNILKSKVAWQTWLEQTREAVGLARQIGEKIILLGHSTGALALLWLALENSDDIEGFIFFSPAFQIQTPAMTAISFFDRFKFDFKTPIGRVISAHAGIEVSKMIQNFHDKFRDHRIQDIPLWMANTECDFVISPGAALKYFENHQAKLVYHLPRKDLVTHDAIATRKNPKFDDMVKSIGQFYDLR